MRNAECGMRNEKNRMRSEQQRQGALMFSSFAAFTILAMGLPFLPSCSNGKQPPRGVAVVAETADQKDVPLQIKAIGNVEAYNTVSIKSQVSGEIADVLFREGQDVKK